MVIYRHHTRPEMRARAHLEISELWNVCLLLTIDFLDSVAYWFCLVRVNPEGSGLGIPSNDHEDERLLGLGPPSRDGATGWKGASSSGPGAWFGKRSSEHGVRTARRSPSACEWKNVHVRVVEQESLKSTANPQNFFSMHHLLI